MLPLNIMVFSGEDPACPIGMGKLLGYVDILIGFEDDSGNEHVEEVSTPFIVMEDGELYLGCECWWCPA